MTRCSIFCHPDEPCWLTGDGVCFAMREFTEERAAIREYCGGQSRAEAEAEAGAVEDFQRWRQHERIPTNDSK